MVWKSIRLDKKKQNFSSSCRIPSSWKIGREKPCPNGSDCRKVSHISMIHKLGCLTAHLHHCPEKYVPSRLWVCRCLLILSERLKHLPHTGQLYGFSPVWILMCTFRWAICVKPFPQIWQRNGFSPVWLRWCSWSLPEELQHFPHTPHR